MTQPGSVRFPDGFMWGAATAAHQIEGNNTTNDHWAMENVPGSPFKEPSGDACDSYHRYGEDIALLASAGLSVYRFSVEWARVEPEPGAFSVSALDHYLRMVRACHRAGVIPMLTLNHFTVPTWLARAGAWDAPEAPDHFARYCAQVAAHMGQDVTWYCTLNEPNLGAMMTMGGLLTMSALEDLGAVVRLSPEAEAAFAKRIGGDVGVAKIGNPIHIATAAGISNVIRAHVLAREAIKATNPAAKVGWTLALVDFQSVDGGEQVAAQIQEAGGNQFLRVASDDDFIGVQTYTRQVMTPSGALPPPEDSTLFQTGWEAYPQALGHTVRWAFEVSGAPVFVTENGMATSDDAARIHYTQCALQSLEAAIADGIPVLGYLHWSLLDNFEWYSGFAMTFGLVAVDRSTFARTPKPSLAWLGAVATSNGATLAPALA